MKKLVVILVLLSVCLGAQTMEVDSLKVMQMYNLHKADYDIVGMFKYFLPPELFTVQLDSVLINNFKVYEYLGKKYATLKINGNWICVIRLGSQYNFEIDTLQGNPILIFPKNAAQDLEDLIDKMNE